MKWRFRELEPGDIRRNPREEEFYRETPKCGAVVRESVQNSLDAKRDGTDHVRVRFSLEKLKTKEIEDYFGGLYDHLEACEVRPGGINAGVYPETKFLAIEDFGTTGLDGPISLDASSGNFFRFWRCEGESEKGGRDIGTFGLGKTVHHMASMIKSFFGFTVRPDGKELLMGKALLRAHQLSGRWYEYYGFFSEEGGRPVRDPDKIADFREVFPVSRNNEPGLSIVIPLPSGEMDFESIIRSAIVNYFFPILRGDLAIEVSDCDSDGSWLLDSESLLDVARSTDWRDTSWSEHDDEYIEKKLQFVKRAAEMDFNGGVLTLPESVGVDLEIKEESLENIEKLRDLFNGGKLLGFEVPVEIKEENAQPEETSFRVYLKKYPREELKKSDEIYVRSGILVSKEGPRMEDFPVRSALVAEEETVSEFLGAAEMPAHNQWNDRRDELREKYDRHRKRLSFIRGSPAKIARILHGRPEKRYPELLEDIFYIEEAGEKKGKKTLRPPELPPPQPSLLKPDKFRDGFKISFVGDDDELPISGYVEVAYDRLQGDPFENYDPSDFDLRNMNRSGKGYKIDRVGTNEILFKMTDSNSVLKVTGFGSSRDLITNCEVREK